MGASRTVWVLMAAHLLLRTALGAIRCSAWAICREGIFTAPPRASRQTAVLSSVRALSASGYEAFRWTAVGGMVGLGDLPGNIFQGSPAAYRAMAASWLDSAGAPRVCKRFVGPAAPEWSAWETCRAEASAAEPMAFRRTDWSLWEGAIGVGRRGLSLDERHRHGRPGKLAGRKCRELCLRNLGQRKCRRGLRLQLRGKEEAFRWTSGGGMVGLGDLPGGSSASFATGVSADGSVIVGMGTMTSICYFSSVSLDERRRHGRLGRPAGWKLQ